MKRRLINGDTGAAFGLIAGIILGSLLLNLVCAATRVPPGVQSAAAGTSAAATDCAVASQR